MATSDYNLANQSGASFRAELNDILSSIVTNNSSASEPATRFPYMWWADTTSGQLKQRNAANNAWINKGLLTSTPIDSGGGTLTGDVIMSGASVIFAEGADVTAAATANIWATDGNTRHITGNTNITSFGTAPQAGTVMNVIFDGVPLLTHSANLNLNNNGSNIQIEAGDMAIVYADTTTQFSVFIIRKSGNPLNFLKSLPDVIGYDAGAGGQVTQLAAKTTSVTLNKPTGRIITNNGSLGSLVAVTFTVNNSLVTAADTVVSAVSSSANYQTVVTLVATGSFQIRLTNISGGTLAEAVSISFTVIKGAIF